MATFIMVHGGWHGGWCWQRVTPLLERQGHRVLAPDLPAHGDDHTPVTARPWEHYAATIAGLIERQPASVILVGHSSGGMVISAAARLVPDRIAALVYLAAFLLPPGATPRGVIAPDSGSLLMDALAFDPEAGTMSVRPEKVGEVFFHDCAAADAEWAISRLRPEPVIPPDQAAAAAPLQRDEGAIPRLYIETTLDRALPIAVQRQMNHALPRDRIYSMSTGHSPFLAAPEQLAGMLSEIASRFADSPGTRMKHANLPSRRERESPSPRARGEGLG